MLSTFLKRALLRRLYRKVVNPLTLLGVLQAFTDSRVDESSSGKALIGTAGNGHSVTFEIVAGVSPAQMAEVAAEFEDLYDTAKLNLGGTPTDAAIYGEMLALLKPSDEVYGDFSGLRCEVTA